MAGAGKSKVDTAHPIPAAAGHKLIRMTTAGFVYRQLAALVSARLPGEKMPAYRDLMREFSTNQRGLDTAYEQLREEGAVECKPKSGVIVRNPYANALVVLVCSTIDFLPGLGTFVRQAYLALCAAIPHYLPGARVELLVIDYDPESAVRESRLRQRLADLLERYRVLGVLTVFRLNGPQTHDFCRCSHVPLIDMSRPMWLDSGIPGGVVHGIEVGLSHLREEGWPCRLAVIAGITDASHRTSKDDDALRKIVASYDAEMTCEIVPVNTGESVVEAGALFVKRLLAENRLPDAMLVSDDYLMQGMIVGALEEGVKLAEMCAVVAFCNEGAPIRASRALTCIEYRHTTVAEQRLRTIAETLRNPQAGQGIPTTHQLVIGQSSRRADYPLRPGNGIITARGTRRGVT